MFAAVDDPISLQITVLESALAILIELGKVRWSTRKELGVEFMVVEEDQLGASTIFSWSWQGQVDVVTG